MTRLVLATRNEGKVREITSLLRGLPLEILTLRDFPGVPELAEEGDTFAANAAAKALAVARATGLMALADDSGLEVDHLEGAPGVRSSRFAGEKAGDAENNHKLLRMLAGVPRERRTARFRCVVAIALPDGSVSLAEGSCEGIITEEPRGGMGFGYDPLFLVPGLGLTFAELDPGIKNEISHRGRAMRRAREALARLLGQQPGGVGSGSGE